MPQDTTQAKSDRSEDEIRNALLQFLQLIARDVVKRLKQQQATTGVWRAANESGPSRDPG